MTLNPDTAHDAAAQIIEQMSDRDRSMFTPDGWYDGISSMMTEEWSHLDAHDVLDAIESKLEAAFIRTSEELWERVWRMTPAEAWETFVGPESPMEWIPSDSNNYVLGSPLCADLDHFAREKVRELLFDHVLAQISK